MTIKLNLLDISPNNVLLSVRDPSVWGRVQKSEEEYPSPRKTLSERTIYLPQQVPLVDGVATLTEFGSARMGEGK